MEIERKFLVEKLPDEIDRALSEPIEQGYLAVSPESEVRIRSLGKSELVLTAKRGSGRKRLEEEITLDHERTPFAETLVRIGPALLVATVAAVIACLALRASLTPDRKSVGRERV